MNELEPEELVVTIYGGDDNSSVKVLRQYEVLSTPKRELNKVVWYIDGQIEFKADGPIWINGVRCSTPVDQQKYFRDLALPIEAPRFIKAGNDVTIYIGPALITFK